MTYAPANFEAAMSNSLEEMHLQELFDFTLNLGSRSNEALPSRSCDYVTAKFEVATANG